MRMKTIMLLLNEAQLPNVEFLNRNDMTLKCQVFKKVVMFMM